MCSRHWLAVSVLAIGGGLSAWAQPQPAPYQPQPYPPQYQQGYPPAAQQQDTMQTFEMKTELRKAQIQAALADRIAQVKESAAKTFAANSDRTTEDARLSAQADALMTRASAEIAKISADQLDLQVRNPPPPQAQYQAQQQQPQMSPQLQQQLMQMDLKKAQIQTAAAAQLADIRQRQYQVAEAQQKAGQIGVDKLSDAQVDLESAKANAEIAKLDESVAQARLNALAPQQPQPPRYPPQPGR